MKCLECGIDNGKKSRFCIGCGAELTREKKSIKKIMKKTIAGIILAVVLFFVVLFSVRLITFRVVMGKAKDLDDYTVFNLEDVEKIVTEQIVGVEDDGDNEINKYFYNEDGVCLARIKYFDEETLNYISIFDEYGNKTIGINIEIGSRESLEVDCINEYQYDDDDKIIREKVYDSDTGEPSYYIVYKYDEEDNVIKQTRYSDDFKSLISLKSGNKYINDYDDDQLVSIYIDRDYGEWEEYEYEYDSEGNMVSEEYSVSDEGIDDPYTKTFEYDDDGKLLRMDYYIDYESGSEKYTGQEYVYDSYSGLLREMWCYTEEGYRGVYNYFYDHNKDLSEKTFYGSGNQLLTRYFYTTEYVEDDVKVILSEGDEYPDFFKYFVIIEIDD